MKPHLPKLIPKLYRYQFDPNERIQEAMGSLWQVVVTDPDKAKLEYLDDILAEIIPSVGSRLWRVREASCLALADLMSGKRFEQVEKHLVEVYRMSLRAMDDVKETVRNAGTMLNRAISTLCIRLCDSQQSGEVIAGKTLGLLLPFLLEEGISQTAAEVRVASIQQMVKLVKGAGPSLRPYIPDIAVVLIESLSSLEPMMNTYVQQHAERMDSAVAEKFERARLSAARNTPLTETLEMCLRVIDEEGADATLPRLIPIVRTGVGLPTRCGVAKFVSTLAGSHATRQAVKKHSVKLLKSLATGLEDRSSVVRHAMASAAAKVFAVAKEQGRDEYVAHLTDMFEARGADDAGVRACVALAFKELMSAASDHMKDYNPAVLPLAFMARNDVDEAARECWEQVWSEGAGSTAAGVRVLMGELAALIPKRLESASWEARRTTAVSCREYAEALGSSVAPHFNGLLAALESCVKGKVWDGKEEVLLAISALAVAAKAQVRADGLACRVGSLLFGECGKKRKEYRTGAFKAAKEFASEFKVEVGGASSLLPIVADLFASDEGGSKASSGPSAGRDADAEAVYEVQLVKLPSSHLLEHSGYWSLVLAVVLLS
jgi:proteasome component ECM29